MESSTTDNFLLSCFLFGISFCGISLFIYSAKHQPSKPVPSGKDILEQSDSSKGLSYHLACLLEDAPETALRGQCYELATPLMTPLACILTSSWHHFYRNHLGKPGINYWQWRDKPESHNVCQELSVLFDLPVAQGYAKEVLECLGEGKYPFARSRLFNKSEKSGNLFASLTDIRDDGKFACRDLQIQIAMSLSFKQWHQAASQQIGLQKLQAVYQVCYGTSWTNIQQILGEDQPTISAVFLDDTAPWWKILQVKPSADKLQVEQAYKQLVRIWHPDRNQHPQATQITSRLNVAYQHYRSLGDSPALRVTPLSHLKIDPKAIEKIWDWLKPLWHR